MPQRQKPVRLRQPSGRLFSGRRLRLLSACSSSHQTCSGDTRWALALIWPDRPLRQCLQPPVPAVLSGPRTGPATPSTAPTSRSGVVAFRTLLKSGTPPRLARATGPIWTPLSGSLSSRTAPGRRPSLRVIREEVGPRVRLTFALLHADQPSACDYDIDASVGGLEAVAPSERPALCVAAPRASGSGVTVRSDSGPNDLGCNVSLASVASYSGGVFFGRRRQGSGVGMVPCGSRPEPLPAS
jgi:hypothetical protein